MQTHLFASILTLIWAAATQALIGYDCGGQGLNITSLSLLDIGKCQVDDIEPQKKEVYIQLLQLSEFEHTTGIQCKIEIDRTVYYCGMHSHVSIVYNGKREYIREVSADTCKKLHDSGSIFLGNNALITGIKVNSTTYHSLTYAGTITNDGKCTGTQFSDPYGTWDNVVVQASIKITTRRIEIPIKHSTNEAILPSGAHCSATIGECNDADGMTTYWAVVPPDSCRFNRYDVLYQGPAYRLSSKLSQSESPVIYTVTTKETTFALAKTMESNLCGYKMIQTEHPKLSILETHPDRVFKTSSKIAIDNLDIFSYVNSKFIYVEKHLKTQLTQLYRDILEQKCALERQILQNALSLASIAPDEMAHRIMKTPGYTAILAGEAIHLIKCVPVECRIRQVDTCYNELPVTHQNQSLFLSPRSRILTRSGTPKDCNELLPTMYHIHNTWYRLLPKPTESLAPPIIQPLTKPSWKYVSPSSLATSGIYTHEDINRLRDHIMFPMEKPSMLNTIARGAMGQEIPAGSFSMLNLLDEKTLDHIAESAGARLWRGFVTFGSASAGILAIFMIARFIKLIIDTIIHGYALHSLYGWSLHLLGAIWSSVTNLLLYLGRRNNDNNDHRPANPHPTSEELQPKAPPTSEDQHPLPSVTHVSEVPKNYKELRRLLEE